MALLQGATLEGMKPPEAPWLGKTDLHNLHASPDSASKFCAMEPNRPQVPTIHQSTQANEDEPRRTFCGYENATPANPSSRSTGHQSVISLLIVTCANGTIPKVAIRAFRLSHAIHDSPHGGSFRCISFRRKPSSAQPAASSSSFITSNQPLVIRARGMFR